MKRSPNKRQQLIRKLCVQYDLVEVFLRALIDFKLASMLQATQGLALLQNEDDAEQEDEVKTQASGLDEEIKQEGASPVVASGAGLSLTSTPVINRQRQRSLEMAAAEPPTPEPLPLPAAGH